MVIYYYVENLLVLTVSLFVRDEINHHRQVCPYKESALKWHLMPFEMFDTLAWLLDEV
jgi:hypothetical protein